jgi:hypothetical protein
MQPIIKLELLAKGIVLQIMRMMCERAREYTDSKIGYCWIIDMRSTEVKNKSVKKISMKSYQRTEELFAEALNKMISSKEDDRSTANQHYAFDSFSKGKKHTLNMFKRLGKEMQLIIPQKGIGERFSMPEDIAKFLVLSLIKPNEKITFNLFLEKLYNNYKIIIGPKEYSEQACASGYDLDQSNYFDENAKEFQNFLKKAGFLRDLSDATSIVVNPYKVVETK